MCLASGQTQIIPDEDWGYVDVRPDAHMFWWLYGAQTTQRDSLPLIMWLQVQAHVCMVNRVARVLPHVCVSCPASVPISRRGIRNGMTLVQMTMQFVLYSVHLFVALLPLSGS